MRSRLNWIMGLMAGLLACQSLPEPDRGVKTQFLQVVLQGDSMTFAFRNSLSCPVQVKVAEKAGSRWLSEPRFVLLGPKDSTHLFTIDTQGLDSTELVQAFRVTSTYSHPAVLDIDSTYEYAFPFSKPEGYRVMQAYGGNFSHTSDYSRYAIDFAMPAGDTICAAREGVVIGLIEGNEVGGGDRKFRPYANLITIFHVDGTLAQYVHLAHEGVLVALGDTIAKRQPIGISGTTGFTSAPHLHFAVLKPIEAGAESFPVLFEGIAGRELRKNMRCLPP